MLKVSKNNSNNQTSMRVCLVTPPFVQLNTPYPATTQLKAFLKEAGHDVMQCDIGIEVAEKIFCKSFLTEIFEIAYQKDRLSAKAKDVAMNKGLYLKTIDPIWRFLQGKDSALASTISSRALLPEGPMFKKVKDEDLEWAYGTTGVNDRARYIATLYIEDLALFVSEIVGCDFSLIRYGEKLAISAPSFEYIYGALQKPLNIIEKIALDIFKEKIDGFSPDVVGFTAPFPGTLVMGLRMAQYLKANHPNITTAMGGGYVNTELRSISDARFFEFIDFLLFDDGELPLSSLLNHLSGAISKDDVVMAKYLDNGVVVDSKNRENRLDFNTLPAPDFSDLHHDKYISLVEFTNPMHRLWSDGRWNKMTVAHGCYWAKCTFCDTKLDYIGRYSATKAETVVDRMEAIMAQTKSSGFHFTDEALPPKLLKDISLEIIKRGLVVTFWGNVRFEKSFTVELCEILSQAGCIAVSGGLEVASPRILKLINKGVTIEDAISACAAFNSGGIMVHAYLMYGFPTQKGSEAVESLEIVRQMFEQGIIQSGFWHKYTMTIHSPTGCDPEKFGAVRKDSVVNSFANNGVEFDDQSSEDWNTIGFALKTATQNFMQGKGYNLPMKNWFGREFENPTISKRFTQKIVDRIFGEE